MTNEDALRTRLLLVDDHEIVRRGLAELLMDQQGFSIVGEAGTAEGARLVASGTSFDVAILDLRLPDGNGIELCREFRSDHPDVACLIITSYNDAEALAAAALAGAHGYLLKNVKGSDFVDGVRRVARGESLMDSEQVRATLDAVDVLSVRDPLVVLTPRERAVLSYIADGMTNRQIASAMFLAEKTIKNYVSTILMKLNVSRRTEAAVVLTRIDERRKAVGQN